jgi:hypothetical protein
MRALAEELAPEFGPVRVFRPYRNRRVRPDAPRYRTDTGGTARDGALGVVLTPGALTATAAHGADPTAVAAVGAGRATDRGGRTPTAPGQAPARGGATARRAASTTTSA